MTVKLLTEHQLEFLNLTGAEQTGLSLHLSKCHTVLNHRSRLNYHVEKCHDVHARTKIIPQNNFPQTLMRFHVYKNLCFM